MEGGRIQLHTRLFRRMYAAFDGRLGTHSNNFLRIINILFLFSGLVSFSNRYLKNNDGSSTMQLHKTCSATELTKITKYTKPIINFIEFIFGTRMGLEEEARDGLNPPTRYGSQR